MGPTSRFIRPRRGSLGIPIVTPRAAMGVLLGLGLWLSGPASSRVRSEPGGARDETPRIASRSASAAEIAERPDPVAQAKKAIAECRARYAGISDYTCTFVKRERIGKTLIHPHVMEMKVRSHPNSIYFKFRAPNKGREAIFVAGRNGGKIVAHDVGLGKLLAGTMVLDPRGSMAMEECRHPITEAGIGALIDTVAHHWNAELTREESLVSINRDMRIGPRACTMIETVHPERHPHFLFHKVRLYIDHEHGLPIRFEAYDWPAHSGASVELVEEYTYTDLRLNVGLSDKDFDPTNRAYSYGRF